MRLFGLEEVDCDAAVVSEGDKVLFLGWRLDCFLGVYVSRLGAFSFIENSKMDLLLGLR